MKNDEFGDRMKLYEQAEAGRQLIPLLPAVVRLDGKAFHTWTADLDRPFDKRMVSLMQATTVFLVDKIGARVGYTQSDEISLVLHSDTFESQIFYDGKIQKLCSVLASFATGYFNSMAKTIGLGDRPLAFFDCRVWNVPNKEEAANAILWREQDASKNSISMLARTYFSHKELNGKSGSEMQEMLFQKHKINWNDCPAFFKRGSFYSRRKTVREFTEEELMKIPEAHKPAPGAKLERTEIRLIEMPKFSTVLNRVEVIFDGADPKVAS